MTAQEVQPPVPQKAIPNELQTPLATGHKVIAAVRPDPDQLPTSNTSSALPQPTSQLESSMPGKSNPTGSSIKKKPHQEDVSPMLNRTAVRNSNAAQVVLPSLPLQMKAGSSTGIYSRQLCLMLKPTRHT